MLDRITAKMSDGFEVQGFIFEKSFWLTCGERKIINFIGSGNRA
jgi:hypothetical protein